MSTVEVSTGPSMNVSVAVHNSQPQSCRNGSPGRTRLHRIRTVRNQQGISLRTVARGRRVPMRQVREEERPTSDVTLSTLYTWQRYLEVPVADLLIESHDPLSRPVMERARLVKLMKTIVTIRERATSEGTQRLAEMLFEQFCEIMPELAEVQPWQRVGQRRTLDELGIIVERQLSDDFFSANGS